MSHITKSIRVDAEGQQSVQLVALMVMPVFEVRVWFDTFGVSS